MQSSAKNRLILSFLAFFTMAHLGYAQVPVVIALLPQLQFFDQSGRTLSFGCVFTYACDSPTPLATSTDYTGNTLNSNPVVLSAGGSANIWIQAGLAYAFKVKSSGGVNCASGATLYTVSGIGGGISILTTNVAFSATPTFTIAAQQQLFTITLTGNATSNPLTGVGILSPAVVTWQITQDSSGGHTFAWPANTVGGATICSAANCVTQQTFIWNGTNATALGPATYSVGPAYAVTSLYDFALTANSAVCTDANKQLTSAGSCTSVFAVTYNGQTVGPGGSGNVNAGAATHSVALNQGNGNAITGLTLGANQIPVGVSSADPVASTLPTCGALSFYTFSGTLPITCGIAEAVQASSITLLGSPVVISGTTTILTKAVTMPAAGCPCRAFVSYGINFDGSNSGEMTTTVNDGTNTFATGSMNTTGSATQFAIQASSYSTGTYTNGAAITFTLQGATTMAGSTNAHVANGNGLGQASYMNVAIFTSN